MTVRWYIPTNHRASTRILVEPDLEAQSFFTDVGEDTVHTFHEGQLLSTVVEIWGFRIAVYRSKGQQSMLLPHTSEDRKKILRSHKLIP